MKKDKVVKQCPRCKIYTEKNEGCNHMTCTECKYQWCWLCEGEYQDGHFRTGQCNGLQFVKINYLSEKDKLPRVIPRNQYAHNPYRDEVGCCLCVNHIQNKFDFCGLAGPFGFYYGNKKIELIISIICSFFFLIPIAVIRHFLLYPDYEHKNRVTRNPINRFLALLTSIMMFIPYQYYWICIAVLYSIVVIPCSCLLSCITIIQDGNDTYDNIVNYSFSNDYDDEDD